MGTEPSKEKIVVKKKFGSRSKSRINRIRQSLRGSSEVPSGTGGIVELLNSRVTQTRRRPEFIPSSAEGPRSSSSRENNDPVIDDKSAAKLADRRKNLFKSRNRVRIQRPPSGSPARVRPSIIDIEERPRSIGIPAANKNSALSNLRSTSRRRPVTPQAKTQLPTTAAAKQKATTTIITKNLLEIKDLSGVDSLEEIVMQIKASPS